MMINKTLSFCALVCALALSVDAAHVSWHTAAPDANVIVSYAPQESAGALNFYSYNDSTQRQVAQTFSLTPNGNKVKVSALTLKLGRDVIADGVPGNVTIRFYQIHSATARGLDPTRGVTAGEERARLVPVAGGGKTDSYVTITFDKPIVLETDAGVPGAYAFVLAFDEPAAEQQLLLALGKNTPGQRVLLNTDNAGWNYGGGNPSLVYYLQGTVER